MNAKELLTARKVVGTKETLRAAEKGLLKAAFVAEDASPGMVAPLLDACEQNGVPVFRVENMKYLGECCGIKVSAASAGML